MISVQELRDDLTDESLRVATVVGLVSIPFTVILSGRAEPHVIAGTPLLVAGLVVGYVYSKRPTESRRAGRQTGLVGSIGVVLWQLSYMLPIVWAESVGIAVVLAALTPVTVVVGVGLAVLIGVVGALIGDWVTARFDRVRPNGLGS